MERNKRGVKKARREWGFEAYNPKVTDLSSYRGLRTRVGRRG